MKMASAVGSAWTAPCDLKVFTKPNKEAGVFFWKERHAQGNFSPFSVLTKVKLGLKLGRPELLAQLFQATELSRALGKLRWVGIALCWGRSGEGS